ncbi:winged helix-turn-helix transcriptional regulator [Candidatus Kaiserbacteria bacterium]|nr:winged helix-turn-helix transcriptional regulator [Candidatus Kaiserbacteria bacterium]
MSTLALIFIGLLGILLGYTMGRRDIRARMTAFVNEERLLHKEKWKGMIMKHLRERGELTNSDVRELLGVSDTTVVRYFDELEKEGKVVQTGKSGRGVHYELA